MILTNAIIYISYDLSPKQLIFIFTCSSSLFLQVSSINRVLRNLVSTKEQHSAVHAHAAHMSAAAAHAAATDSSAGIYDKLRMFNGANAAAASWAW